MSLASRLGDLAVAIGTDIKSLNTNTMQKTLLSAKGSILAASGLSTPSEVTVGSNGQVLRARSSKTAGVGWSPEYLGPIRRFAANEWRANYPMNNSQAVGASGGVAVGLIHIPFDFTLDGLSCHCGTAATTSGTVRTIMYADNNGSPGLGVASTSAISILTTGLKAETGLAVTGTRGLYWCGWLVENAGGSPAFQIAPNNPAIPWVTNSDGTGATPTISIGNSGYAAIASGASGNQVGVAFGGSLATNHNNPANIPVVWFKFSSITL